MKSIKSLMPEEARVQCKGFLFDLDGTLVDSLPAVERAWCSWADRLTLLMMRCWAYSWQTGDHLVAAFYGG